MPHAPCSPRTSNHHLELEALSYDTTPVQYSTSTIILFSGTPPLRLCYIPLTSLDSATASPINCECDFIRFHQLFDSLTFPPSTNTTIPSAENTPLTQFE